MPLCPKRGDFWLARPMQKAKHTNMNARGPHANSRGPRAVLLGRARGGVAARRQRLRRGGVRRDEGIPPYGRLFGHRHPVWPEAENLFVGAGFTAPAGAFRRPTAAQRRLLGRRSRPWNLAPPSGPRADMESAPTGGKAMPTAARGRLPRRRLAGRCEHRPLQSQRHFRLRPHRGVCGGARRADMESAPTVSTGFWGRVSRLPGGLIPRRAGWFPAGARRPPGLRRSGAGARPGRRPGFPARRPASA